MQLSAIVAVPLQVEKIGEKSYLRQTSAKSGWRGHC